MPRIFEYGEKEIRDHAETHIPGHMVDSMVRFIMDGIPPGDFLLAVLSNDLREAVSRADDHNLHRLYMYVQFLFNYTPTGCWGSTEKACDWVDRGGLNGIEKQANAEAEIINAAFASRDVKETA